jgi:multidrug efflux system outer membrane protein
MRVAVLRARRLRGQMRFVPVLPSHLPVLILALAPLIAAATAAPAFAQGEAQQLPSSTAPTPAAAAPQVSTPVPLPVPNVTDPMLTPVPAAEKQVGSWREALALLRSRSTDLRTAYDEVLKAEASERLALAQILPSLGLGINGTHNFITNTTVQITGVTKTGAPTFGAPITTPIKDSANGSIQLQQTVFNLEQFYAIGTAREQTRANALTYDDMKRTLALSAANAIVGVVTAERVAELNRSGLRQSLERLDLTVRKQKLGAATGLDVVRAQTDVESARTTLVTGDEALRKSRESLGLALGLPAEVGVPRDLQIDGLEREAISACKVTNDVNERADLRSLAKKADVAGRLINDAWLQFVPTVNAQSAASTTTVNTGVVPEPQWSIQGVLSWNIWDGGTRYGNLRTARANYDEALLAFESNKRQALIQIEQARRAVAVADDQLRVADRARALSVQTDELTQAAYREGQLTSLDLVTAAAARRQAEINYALDEFTLVQARVGAVMALANCSW